MLLPKTGNHTREQKVWVGNGLSAIPKKVHEKIMNWGGGRGELVELRPAGNLYTLNQEPGAQKCIIMPGLEMTQAIKDIRIIQ